MPNNLNESDQSINALDSLSNLFQNESAAMKELQFKLMHKSKLEEVMRRVLATNQARSAPRPASSYIERRMLECIKTVVYFDDLGSVH